MASSLFGPKAVQPQPYPQQMPGRQPAGNPAQGSSQIQGIKNLMTMMQSGGNSRKMAEMILSRVPGYQDVMNLVNQYGGGEQGARAAFYAEAERKGVDPNLIFEMLR